MNYHQALVDVVRLLQGLALALRLLGHLTSGQVDKVDLPVSVQTIFSSKKYCQQSEPSHTCANKFPLFSQKKCVKFFLLGNWCSKPFLSDNESVLQCPVIQFWTILKLCPTWWYRLLCCHHLKLSLRCKSWCEFECWHKVILSHLCMWTVSMVWLRLLCSFMLWVPIALFFKPSSSTANKSSSSAHSMLQKELQFRTNGQ